MVAGIDVHRPLEAVVTPEQLGYSADRLYWRIVGVETHFHPRLLGDGQQFADEMLVICPEFVFGVRTIMSVRAVDLFKVERRRSRASAYGRC